MSKAPAKPSIADPPRPGRVYSTAFTDLEGDPGPTEPLWRRALALRAPA